MRKGYELDCRLIDGLTSAKRQTLNVPTKRWGGDDGPISGGAYLTLTTDNNNNIVK